MRVEVNLMAGSPLRRAQTDSTGPGPFALEQLDKRLKGPA
jgi:hypothetical protein